MPGVHRFNAQIVQVLAQIPVLVVPEPSARSARLLILEFGQQCGGGPFRDGEARILPVVVNLPECHGVAQIVRVRTVKRSNVVSKVFRYNKGVVGGKENPVELNLLSWYFQQGRAQQLEGWAGRQRSNGQRGILHLVMVEAELGAVLAPRVVHGHSVVKTLPGKHDADHLISLSVYQ